MLLLSEEKGAYVGFIPNDQAGFVERIRHVIKQQRINQAMRTGTVNPVSSISVWFKESSYLVSFVF